jgi:uncharacterized protein with NAD-binding domain and iron-sulfur cluster
VPAPTNSPTPTPIDVAILGGGLGAIASAFELTATPELRERYNVIVYQQGWRLGGKGASGRQVATNGRVVEHGLHQMMGWYSEVFEVLRAAYDEWERPAGNPFQSIDDAFQGQSRITLAEWVEGAGGTDDGRYEWWNVQLPELPGAPGDQSSGKSHAQLTALIVASLEQILEDLAEHHRGGNTSPPPWLGDLHHGAHPDLRAARVHVDRLAADGFGFSPGNVWRLHRLYRLMRKFEQWLVEEVDDLLDTSLTRRLYLLLKIGVAFLRGLIWDVWLLRWRGFDWINRYDLKEWLERHGASAATAWSAPIRAFYDLSFGYKDGIRDREHAQVAAGEATKALMHMALDYKGSFLFKMSAGMGDTIFTPLFEVLQQRGVRFEFFHRVEKIGLSADGRRVDRVDFKRQVWLTDRNAEYAPLVDVKGLPCWPAKPLFDQIENGDTLHDDDFESPWCTKHVEEYSIHFGEDFQKVVCGIPVGALGALTTELSSASGKWRRAIDKSNTVQTIAAQLWMQPDLAATGWSAGPTVMTGYEPPFASWGEMSQVLPAEAWRWVGAPRSLQYLCGVLSDPDGTPPPSESDFPAQQHERARKLSLEWLGNWAGAIWTDAAAPGNPKSIDFEALVDHRDREGEARFGFQYWTANVSPSERYVLALPGTVKYRLGSGPHFKNLYVAGDWTRTSISGGFAQAAVESGRLASRALIES